MKAKILTKRIYILYYLIFFFSWTIAEWLIKPYIGSYFNVWIATMINSGLLKIIVWVLPCLLLIINYESYLFVNLKEMFTSKVKWLRYLPIFILFSLYIIGISYIRSGEISISNRFSLILLIKVFFVGITEEMVFRGWLLNLMVTNKGINKAIFFNAILFLGIHFPRFIYEGDFIQNIMNGGFLCIIALSIIFSYSFIKSKNIVVPIALHMYWDLMMFLFI